MAADALNVDHLFRSLQHNFSPDICVSRKYTSSSSTRPPSGFDAHLHPNFKLKSLAYDESMLKYTLSSLFKALAEQPEFPSTTDVSSWTNTLFRQLYRGMMGRLIENESDICFVIGELLIAAGAIATRSVIWDVESLTQGSELLLYRVCSAKGQSSIADITIRADTEAPNRLPPEILSLFTPLEDNDVLISSELKHYLMIHPGHILSLYAFIYAIEKSKLTQPELLFPWPVPARCTGCARYWWAHQSYPGNFDVGIFSSDGHNLYRSSNLDSLKSAINMAQAALSACENIIPKNLHHIWPIPTPTLDTVEEEELDDTVGEEDGTQHQQPQSFQSPKTSIRHVVEIVKDCLDELGIDTNYQPKVKTWLQKALIVTTQSWSQLVCNDTTYELVTNFGISWIMHRDRQTQTATFSPFFLANDPNLLLYLSALIHQAHLDAIDRVNLNQMKVERGMVGSPGGPNAHSHTNGDEDNFDDDQHPMPKGSKSKAVLGKFGRSGDVVEGNTDSNSLFNVQELHFALAVSPYFTDGYITLTRVPANLSPVVPATSQMPEMLPLAGYSQRMGNRSAISSGSSFSPRSTALTSPTSSSFRDALVVEHAAIVITALSNGSTIGRIGNGLLTTENDGSFDVVVKLAGDHKDGEKLIMEAKYYAKLQLHSMAEWYLGLFQEEGEEGISGLVMKNLGLPILSFDTLSQKQKRLLYDSVLKIHSANIKHNDLKPQNILKNNDGNIYVIDYHLAEVHDCPGEATCDELLDLYDELEI